MDVVPFLYFIRVVPPVLLLWLAWIVHRTPFQELANRLFASFLFVISLGYLLEFAWFTSNGGPIIVREVTREVQGLLGVLDPPLLLAASLAYLGRRSLLRNPWPWTVYLLAAAFLWWETRAYHVGNTVIPLDVALTLKALYVNGTYLLGFILLVKGAVEETHYYKRRQLGFLAVAVGFAALSRSGVLFVPGGPSVMLLGSPGTIFASLAVASVLYLIIWGTFRITLPRQRDGFETLFVVLGALVLAFHVLWLLSFATDKAIGEAVTTLHHTHYPMRWVVFAAIMGYGSLRFQLFDFDLRLRQALALGAATFSAVAVAMTSATLLWDGPAGGTSLLEARLAGIMAGILTIVPLWWMIMHGTRRLLPVADAVVAWQKRRLEVYEATIEHTVDKPSWDPAERRFVETLREVFEVTSEEHEQVVARLRARQDAQVALP